MFGRIIISTQSTPTAMKALIEIPCLKATQSKIKCEILILFSGTKLCQESIVKYLLRIETLNSKGIIFNFFLNSELALKRRPDIFSKNLFKIIFKIQN